ncbi:Uncharacterized protein APZ42_014647 [Daphnia magna]|uniref:Uncharacterized protein n=1 Tax=Daphnia magna TaxID=35525 RepID=A0A162PSN9_9CRUS|nr:Uncharacterized protein APZ42_014647 [Daphnia magna]
METVIELTWPYPCRQLPRSTSITLNFIIPNTELVKQNIVALAMQIFWSLSTSVSIKKSG